MFVSVSLNLWNTTIKDSHLLARFCDFYFIWTNEGTISYNVGPRHVALQTNLSKMKKCRIPITVNQKIN